ncbi:MAG: hypothetical protein ACTSU4_02250 [Promethearchaeota archaeon]
MSDLIKISFNYLAKISEYSKFNGRLLLTSLIFKVYPSTGKKFKIMKDLKAKGSEPHLPVFCLNFTFCRIG